MLTMHQSYEREEDCGLGGCIVVVSAHDAHSLVVLCYKVVLFDVLAMHQSYVNGLL